MVTRTEEQKLFRAPITVILGGKEYEILPLVIKDARIWRKKLSTLLGKLPGYTKVTTDDAAGFASAIDAMLVGMPDEIADLFFSYAKDLNREIIESTATEVELAGAFEAVMAVAIPLTSSLTGALGRLGR
jgi:hypothetical protein